MNFLGGNFENLSLRDSALPNRGNPHPIVIARRAKGSAWQSIFIFGLLRRICDSPRNDDRVGGGGFYFLQKQKVAKTFAWIRTSCGFYFCGLLRAIALAMMDCCKITLDS